MGGLGRPEFVAGIHSCSSLLKDQPVTRGVCASCRWPAPELNGRTAAGAETERVSMGETDGVVPGEGCAPPCLRNPSPAKRRSTKFGNAVCLYL